MCGYPSSNYRDCSLLDLRMNRKFVPKETKFSKKIGIQHYSSTNPIVIHPLLPTSLPVSTPNTIHHSRLTVCLPDSLDLTRCLSTFFWVSACE